MRRGGFLWVLGVATALACGGAATGPARAPATTAPPVGKGWVMSAAIALPTGAQLTPDAAPGSVLLDLNPHLLGHPDFRAAFATAAALSPDGKTLLVMTSGYNRLEDARGDAIPGTDDEYVFVYDVASGVPHLRQTVGLPNTFWGLAYSPLGDRFYASGGPDDQIHELRPDGQGGFEEKLPPIPLGHLKQPSGLGGLGLAQGPEAAGLATTADGRLLVVANHDNDSVSLVDTATRAAVAEVDLRPGGGKRGGAYPSDVAVVGGDAYVVCQRDAEVVDVSLTARAVKGRAHVGAQPTRMTVSRDGATLFVANANDDTVSVIDRATLKVRATIPVGGPAGSPARALRGASPNGLGLSPDGRTLYVTLGGLDAVAMVKLEAGARGGALEALVPTGFYPTDVVTSKDGARLFVAFGKSAEGPNPRGPWSAPSSTRTLEPYGGNQFTLQLLRGGVHALPVPPPAVRNSLTHQALVNAGLDAPRPVPPALAALRGKIKHVVYVIGENRTYDQVFGDLEGTDGDPALVHWGESITPNMHALARRFVAADRFFDAGGVSGDGWQWSTAGRATDAAEKEVPLMYAGRGRHTYDWEGCNRNVNVGLATLDQRRAANPLTPNDPDLLPGVGDMAAPAGPAPFLWDEAIAAGLSVRNYGFFVDDYRYGLPDGDPASPGRPAYPFAGHHQVAFPTAPGLLDRTDPYFYGFEMRYPDLYRVKEWMREMADYEREGDMPALELVRLPHDHFGAFGKADAGVDTPDTQMADHDYALGLLVQRLSRSKFWEDTLVVIVEDDAQNGADHVDSHRSFVLFAGGHVARGAVVHTRYSTPSVLRTIEVLLGLPPLAQPDAAAPPIVEAFTDQVDRHAFRARVPDVLRSTKLPLPRPRPEEGGKLVMPRGTGRDWALATMGMDFSHEDRLPAAAFNAALYCGLVDVRGCTTRADALATAPRDDDDD